jgi:hypothetical protein
MSDLIDHQWLAGHMEKHGDDPQRWTDEQKDEAVNQALHQTNNFRRLVNESMIDFFSNHCLKPLYEAGHTPLQQNELTRNEIWGLLESDIVDQCREIERNRIED